MPVPLQKPHLLIPRFYHPLQDDSRAACATIDHLRLGGCNISGRVNRQTVHSGSSYCSQSELTLTFGLGQATQAENVEITWASGQRDTLRNLKANATYTIDEGGKVLAGKSFKL
jgi:hypothetical protein